jgi:mono/diheme cytochrome c family protein
LGFRNITYAPQLEARLELPRRIWKRSICVEREVALNVLHGLILALLVAGSHGLPAANPALPATTADNETFVRATCGGCHAIDGQSLSRNPRAPSFPEIVNTEGVTEETLSVWLRGAHNYPAEMDFYLTDRAVDRIVSYMLTLKDPNFRRPAS